MVPLYCWCNPSRCHGSGTNNSASGFYSGRSQLRRRIPGAHSGSGHQKLARWLPNSSASWWETFFLHSSLILAVLPGRLVLCNKSPSASIAREHSISVYLAIVVHTPTSRLESGRTCWLASPNDSIHKGRERILSELNKASLFFFKKRVDCEWQKTTNNYSANEYEENWFNIISKVCCRSIMQTSFLKF